MNVLAIDQGTSATKALLIGPSEFRDAQYYVLGALGVGLVFYLVQLVTEREAMRKEPGLE